MSVEFGKVAFPPNQKPDDITAEYTGSYGDRRYRFDRPDKRTFELIGVTRRASSFDPPRETNGEAPPEKTFVKDDTYSPAEGVPPALAQEIRRYADRNCADDVTSDNIKVTVDLRY